MEGKKEIALILLRGAQAIVGAIALGLFLHGAIKGRPKQTVIAGVIIVGAIVCLFGFPNSG